MRGRSRRSDWRITAAAISTAPSPSTSGRPSCGPSRSPSPAWPPPITKRAATSRRLADAEVAIAELDSIDARSWLVRARAHLALGHLKEAEDDFRTAYDEGD